MKILHINSYFGGSTGSLCQQIIAKLQSENHEVFFVYGNGPKTTKNYYRVGNKIDFLIHNFFGMLFGNHGMYSLIPTLKTISIIKDKKPDIVHIHNLHGGFFNIKLLLGFLRKSGMKVLITIHDCWLYTGKCYHYYESGCTKFKTTCNHCPQLSMYPKSLLFDRTKKMFLLKKNFLETNNNISIVAISKWLYDEIGKSFLKDKKRYLIKNGINEKFRRIETAKKDFFVLGVASSWNVYKGIKEFITIANSLPHISFVLVGDVNKEMVLPKNIVNIKKTTNIEELVKLYNQCGLYLSLSTQETFGLTIGEALCCGAPCIVYDSTACSEFIQEGFNGYKVAPHDLKKVENMILYFSKHNWNRSRISEKAIRDYNIITMKEQYYRVYKEVLENEK